MTGSRPVALIILDGWGWREETEGNAPLLADTPIFDGLWATFPHTLMTASGEKVGLPPGLMGNSEVGHMNLGAGRIVFQDLSRINNAIDDETFFTRPALCEAIEAVKSNDSALHLMGLCSDGGVHSDLSHVLAMLDHCHREGLKRVFIHAFMDGRDTSPTGGVEYMRVLLDRATEYGYRVATVSGRYHAMDRDKRWERIKKAWDAMVHGLGTFASDPIEALESSYENDVTDEFIEPTVIIEDDRPIGRISNGDGCIFFNFRADRARQMVEALTAGPDFGGFDRGEPPAISLTTMTRYRSDFDCLVIFDQEFPSNPLGEVLSNAGFSQFRIAETEKYAHVTYFFNGRNETPFQNESRTIIPSPKIATYDLQPEMSAGDVSEAFEKQISDDPPDFIVLNFANPDMVGHTGNLPAAIKACEETDKCLGRVLEALHAVNGRALVTADHGNCEIMIDPETGLPHTAHTTSPVPLLFVDPEKPQVTLRDGGILADIAPTILGLLDQTVPEEMTGTSLIES